MMYSLWTKDGEVGRKYDLLDALKQARRHCEKHNVGVEVRGDDGLSMGVACPQGINATSVMERARKRNHAVLAASKRGQTEPTKASAIASDCDGNASHDWLDSERKPDRLFRCRVCDAIGQQDNGKVEVVQCSTCHRPAIHGIKRTASDVTWQCNFHRPA